MSQLIGSRSVRGLLLTLVPLILFTTPLLGQTEDDQLRPGLAATYTGAAKESCRRVDERLAFDWKEASPDRRLPTGPFKTAWRGFLLSQAAGEYRVAVYVSGRVSIKLAGRHLINVTTEEPRWVESSPVSLEFDYHPLTIEYESAESGSRLALFWSGPQFRYEPVGSRQLWHEPPSASQDAFLAGQTLVRALRCSACHEIAGEASPLAAPALDALQGNLHPGWLVNRLSGPAEANSMTRRMPHFGLTDSQSQAVAAYLFHESQPEAKLPAAADGKRKKKKSEKVDPRVAGKELMLTTGCMACHTYRQLGTHGWFGGGDLTSIASKRPPGFFERWLRKPELINSAHRMPHFSWSGQQAAYVGAFLAELGEPPRASLASSKEQLDLGRQLVARHRCQACHKLPSETPQPNRTRLTARSDWNASCLSASARPGQPHFVLSDDQRNSIQQFVRNAAPNPPRVPPEMLLAENNCLSCHPRGLTNGLTETATAIAAEHELLVSILPAMIPPSLENVGDKMHSRSLRQAIERKGDKHREYLRVQMPRFPLEEGLLETLVEHFVSLDRIPDRPVLATDSAELDELGLQVAGGRLVTTDGFGCTSCHQLGDVLPTKAPLNARGPSLSQIGERIRRSWFDRFVRSPARIVPRMEMPSVQVAVHGVLEGDLERQLSAVWDVVNRPGFQPPRANPVRVLRNLGEADPQARAIVITDVIRHGKSTFVKPFVLGLPNRHNVLFDLETVTLAAWSIGDAARQHTEGKVWFWELAGSSLLDGASQQSDFSLEVNGVKQSPRLVGQFPTEIESVEHLPATEDLSGGIQLVYRLQFGDNAATNTVEVIEQYRGVSDSEGRTGFQRDVLLTMAPRNSAIVLNLAGGLSSDAVKVTEHTIALPGRFTIGVDAAAGHLSPDGRLRLAAKDNHVKCRLRYLTAQAVDQFPKIVVELPPPEPLRLAVVPGFEALRLPLSEELMPTALGWRHSSGELFISSLKGRVWVARDTDGDELEDRLTVYSDELAAPYGLYAADDYIDVINKYGVLRLSDLNGDGVADRTETVASGWGHTTDYHDWAVGLPRDPQGNYYVALPCQQDSRSEAAAALRGCVLKLIPREPTVTDPRKYLMETISAGHRFPMGIARNQAGDLFVTDNQGNYNPFNELNHVRAGRRYGFINKLERRPGFAPELTPPAIDIPHPWTRSVNGICFLETPAELQKQGESSFGPFEGQLIGCEYDTRRLIRMSLQEVDGTIQGAAYPFSFHAPQSGSPLLGPLACAVSPQGDLYVGGIRDSGWGGANNVGELVRLRLGDLPCGIREVTTTSSGFEISFTSPVDAAAAADKDSYTISSVTRVSTPAYGGGDKDRRAESVRQVKVAPDRLSVAIDLGDLREGFVYEFRLKNMAPDNAQFFPAEAYYTLRVVSGE